MPLYKIIIQGVIRKDDSIFVYPPPTIARSELYKYLAMLETFDIILELGNIFIILLFLLIDANPTIKVTLKLKLISLSAIATLIYALS